MVMLHFLWFVSNKYVFLHQKNKILSLGHLCCTAVLLYYVVLSHILPLSNNNSLLWLDIAHSILIIFWLIVLPYKKIYCWLWVVCLFFVCVLKCRTFPFVLMLLLYERRIDILSCIPFFVLSRGKCGGHAWSVTRKSPNYSNVWGDRQWQQCVLPHSRFCTLLLCSCAKWWVHIMTVPIVEYVYTSTLHFDDTSAQGIILF